MSTQVASLNGDISDITDTDFTAAQVRLRANTDYIVDPDNNKIRVLDSEWKSVNVDGTFVFTNLVAAADTIVPNTLQYYVYIKLPNVDHQPALGPYVLAPGAQDITDLTPVAPVTFNTVDPTIIDAGVLATAEGYTDAAVTAHEANTNPHTQYVRFVDVNGTSMQVPVVFARVGDPFPPVTRGAILFYGGV